MIAIVGLLVVFASVLGGFTLAGGPLPVLIVWSEYIVIGGTALGTLLISTPASTLVVMIKKLMGIIKANPYEKSLYIDALKLLFELFQAARRDGLAAIETHIEQPEDSDIFNRYANVLSHHHPVVFLCDSLRIVLIGGVPPHDLDALLESEIDVHHEHEEKPVSSLTKVGDSLPGIGIVAAVLGIVVTMQSISGPIEEIGHHVASALIGTFLGVFLAYGFVNPLATKVEIQNAHETRFYHFLRAGIIAFAKGLPPMVSVEFARRAIYPDHRPGFTEMETACKELKQELQRAA